MERTVSAAAPEGRVLGTKKRSVMSDNIIKCDMTEEVQEGAGHKSIIVDISEQMSLQIIPLRRVSATTRRQGVIADKGKELIEKAVKALRPKGFEPEVKQEKGK